MNFETKPDFETSIGPPTFYGYKSVMDNHGRSYVT